MSHRKLSAALVGVCLLLPAWSSPVFARTPQKGGERVLDALESWLAVYYGGDLDLTSKRPLGSKSIGARMGVIPADRLAGMTPADEIRILTEEAAKLDSAAAASWLLQTAAVGIDDHDYAFAMTPHVVRSAGEAALDTLESAEARERIRQVASGAEKLGSRDRAEATRAAALHALGRHGEARDVVEEQLDADAARVRRAAAEALAELGAPAGIDALADRLAAETEPLVIEGLAAGLWSLLDRYREDIGEDTAARVARTAGAALGRGDWSTDAALVDVLAATRHGEAVPALIDVLERFASHPDLVREGKLSGLLRHRTQETLADLTGARYAADEPEAWRAFWEAEGANVSRRLATGERSTTAASAGGNTVVTRFFDIPVEGTRLVFVVDLSGSMAFGMKTGSEVPRGEDTRLDYAKRELIAAVEKLPEEASFNVVTFNGNPEAKRWMRSLVPATEANKRRFAKFVRDMRANGGTNTFAGLTEGLAMHELTYGEKDPQRLDELFVLSDGLPSVGEVVNAPRILDLVEEMTKFSKLRINTVYIADRLSERDRRTAMEAGMKGEEFMRELAARTGGTSVNL